MSVVAATGIGVLRSVWHLPLSHIDGTYFLELGTGSVRFWLTHLLLVLLGILLVWLANGSGGSILLAVLAHTGINTTIGVVAGSTVRDAVAFVGLAAAVVAVIVLTHGRLGRPATDPQHRAGAALAAVEVPR